MYSSLFRELHASRLQLDMTSAEEREMTAGGPDDDGTNDVIRGNDAGVGDQHAIFESQPELMNDQYLASLGNNMAHCASIFQMPEMLGSYYGSNLSNASPGGAFVSRFVTNDGMFGIPYVLRSIGQTELVGCPGLAMAAAVVLPEAFDMTSSITSQLQHQHQQHLQHQQQQQQQHQPSVVDAQQQIQTTAIPSSLLGFAVIAADASGVISVPSSSSSSSPSSSLSVMSASGAGTGGGGGCGESAEDATTAAADDDPGCCGSSSSKASSSRESPHSGIFSNRRCSDEGVPPPTTTTAGGPPSLTEGGGPLDRSTPPPERDLLLHGGGPPVTLDHRRNSLELGCGSRELADGIGHLSQAGVAAAGGAADVPAHLRRASIPCMSVSAARGLARGSVAAAHLAHRPSVPLDYESLKVKLEELTGTVTDGKRAKETTGGDRSRRTSLVSLTHPPPAASGSSSTMTPHPEVDRLTPTLTSTTTVVAGEGTAAGSHAAMRNNGFTGVASYAVAEADEETDYCLQSTCPLQSQEPIDAITAQNAKTLQNPTEDSSSSSSSTSSLSSLSLSSSSWDKFRLQYIIEHVLQYDVRLQEILKRHELEMAAIQLKHRFQWMELEKLLTQRLGDQWRKFITIPALSVPPEGVSTSPWRYPAPVEGLDKTLGQVPRDEPPGSSICVQNPFDPLQTIKEGQADEDQLDSNAIRIYQQQTTATTMQNALQQNGRPVGDVAKSSAITDHAGRRCSTTDACVDTPQRPRAISLSNVFLVGDKVTTNGDKAESRICQNIASSLARRQSSVAIMNPNSSRLHRHTTTSKDVAPSTRPADTSIPTRPDSSASTRSDPSAASIRPDSSASSSRPSTPQGDYRQLLLLAQMLQNQTYNSRMAQPFLPNFLPTFPAVPFQTTNFAASYGCDPASMMALNGGILPMEMMGSENGIELNGFRQTQAPHVEIQPPWTNGHQLSASKNCSLQATGEETSRGLPVGYAQPMNGYPGLPHEVPGIGHTGQTMQGYPLFPGLLPSHLASCQLPSMAQNPWLLRTGGTMGVDCPMSFVTPSSSSLGFPYTMVATNPAFYSLVKDYNSEHM